MEITEKNKCTACEACLSCCPKNAITMSEDNCGFLYPTIQNNICVNCGKCVKVCPSNKDQHSENEIIDTYAFRHYDEDVLMNSSSGGVFTALSDIFMSKGGVIYGVAFDNKMQPYYTKSTNTKDRNLFRGAKYIQAEVKNIYSDVQKELLKDRLVLFVGNPCVVAGLKSVLKSIPNNLICVDVVCNGVPSRGVWRDYLECLESKYGSITSYKFRNKEDGWHGAKLKIVTNSGEEYRNTRFTKSYIDLCFSKYTLRESCKKCKYKCIHREGDFTIGDFWGYDDLYNDYKDEKGVSLLMVNSVKGKMFIEKNELKSKGNLISVNINKIPQTNINKKGVICPDSTIFWEEYKEKGYEFIAKKYTDYGNYNYLKKNIKQFIKHIFHI